MAADLTALLGLERTNLRQLALGALRRAITSGEMTPGTHLSEVDLAQRLQISRGTLREAMRELQQQGLITSGPRGRMLVRVLTPKEIHDIFIVRGALESLAARLIIEGEHRETAVHQLRSALSRMATATGLELEERIEADLDFHRTLITITENVTLLTSWEALEGSIRMSIMYGGFERATENMSVDRHREIVDAIGTVDVSRARETIMAHMRTASRNLVQADSDAI
ncbi:FCD domain-containing protein (plasmid) [Rathayibacter sp. VKM Ac-2803]|uniref:GntR family transcriptional regulator n=1 Tax=Rathayibacter caricis DSM 15933 TaxID=1328867 RepID=A0A2T4UPB6_9MICO|nr:MULTISPECIES: GntR family transcriptional regulator [Rathayibacter]MWV51358.1 FCD domain-containing protein [Rathayibacter sp. VKM Ac-2803]PTL71376.1 GntR family transcriptional regulator [Rathayibacter caricis DSM 15933]